MFRYVVHPQISVYATCLIMYFIYIYWTWNTCFIVYTCTWNICFVMCFIHRSLCMQHVSLCTSSTYAVHETPVSSYISVRETCFVMCFIHRYSYVEHLFDYLLHPLIFVHETSVCFTYRCPYMKHVSLCFFNMYPYVKHASLCADP
jgi:hypothetical protein